MPELRVPEIRILRPTALASAGKEASRVVPRAAMERDKLQLSGTTVPAPWEPFSTSGKLFLDMSHPELKEKVFQMGWQQQEVKLVPGETTLHYTTDGWRTKSQEALAAGGVFQLPESLKAGQLSYAIEAKLRHPNGETRTVWLNNHDRNYRTNRPSGLQQGHPFDLYHAAAFNDTVYRFTNNRRNEPHPHMPALLREAGLNVTPTVVSAAEFEDALKGGATLLMRGTPEFAANDFRNNPDTAHVPAGNYGTGFYFAKDGSALRVAGHFASPSGGTIMRAAIKPEASVVTETQLLSRIDAARTAWMTDAEHNLQAALSRGEPDARANHEEAVRKGQTLFADPGLAALHLGGIDAVTFPNDYVLVLNRSALLADEGNYRPMSLPPGVKLRPEQVPPGFLTA